MLADKIKATSGSEGLSFVCEACGSPAKASFGTINKPLPRYLLLCTRCNRLLGDWKTSLERDRELKALADMSRAR